MPPTFRSRGDKNLAARLLGIATRTVYRYLEREGAEGEESVETSGESVETSRDVNLS